jgi:pimeloyl-ACP methyl ester carboxylesterase
MPEEEPVVDGMLRPQTNVANNATLHYVEQGSGDPVVFVHGSTGDFRGWIDYLPLVAGNYRAIAYSRRGHSPNPWPEDYAVCTPEEHAADLAAFIMSPGMGRSTSSGTPTGR